MNHSTFNIGSNSTLIINTPIDTFVLQIKDASISITEELQTMQADAYKICEVPIARSTTIEVTVDDTIKVKHKHNTSDGPAYITEEEINAFMQQIYQ